MSKIAKALHQVMERCSYVQKQGKNTFHGYKYASEADLLSVLRPAMIDAGLLLIPSVSEVRTIDEHGNTTVVMEYTLAHKDGEVWPEKIRVAGAGNDKAKNGSVGDKGVYKAITGCNKYLLFKLFQIETGDDPERDDHMDKHIPFKGDPIREARETVATDDPHLLVNGETRSAYEVNKEKNGGKTPYQLNKEADEWVSKAKAAIAGMTSEREISAWWDERMKDGGSLDRLKKAHPKKFTDLWSVAEERIAQVQRVPRDRNVMEAG